VSSLVILAALAFDIPCGKTDKQTNRLTLVKTLLLRLPLVCVIMPVEKFYFMTAKLMLGKPTVCDYNDLKYSLKSEMSVCMNEYNTDRGDRVFLTYKRLL